MSINFPTNPSVGDRYTYNNTTYRWDGSKWASNITTAVGVPTDTSDLTNGAGYITGVSTFSGNYNDLTNTPTIPTDNNQLANGAGYITDSVTGDLSITGDMTVGGVLTYEDVTNIDSVGVITARSGIKVPGGSVAIGLDTTQAPLHVKSSVARASIVESTSTDGSYTSFVDPNTSSYDRVQIGSAGNDLVLRTTEVERMRIDSSGNVSIGSNITNSERKVQITQTSGCSAGLRIMQDGNGAYNQFFSGISNWRIGSPQSTDALTFDGGNASTERMRIDSSGRLLLGVSSSSPVASVVVQGNSSGSTSYGALKLARGTATPASDDALGSVMFSDSGHDPAATIIVRRDAGTWTSGSSQPTNLTFNTTGNGSASTTERMRIDSVGRVHIGYNASTNAGTSPVNIVGNGSGIQIARNQTGAPAINEWLGILGFQGYLNAGNSGSAEASIRAIAMSNHTGSSAPADLIFATKSSATGPGSAPTDRMRIDFNGRLLLGANTATGVPATGGMYLKSNSVGSTGACALNLDGTGGDFYALRFNNTGINVLSVSSGSNRISFLTSTGTGIMSLYENQQVQMPNVYVNQLTGSTRDVSVSSSGFMGFISSTLRSKTNIESLSDISWLYSLNPVSFNYRLKEEDNTFSETKFVDETMYGLIAEEVEPVAPEICYHDEDENLLGVEYRKLIPVLLAAVKEQKQQIETLEQRLTDAGI